MSNDPGSGSGDQPGWQGQQPPYPSGYGQQPGDPTAYPGGSYSPAGQPGSYAQPGQHGQQHGQPAYGQAPSWAQQQPGQAPPAWQGGPAGLGPNDRPEARRTGTIGALVDFEFNSFATPVVIKILYVVGLVVIGLLYVGSVIAGFTEGAGYGLLVLLLGGVVALFYVIFFRVFLEFYYAVVRMSEDIRVLRDRP